MISLFSLRGISIRLTPLKVEYLDALCAVGLEPRLWQATTIQVLTRADMEDCICAALSAESRGTAFPFVIIECATDRVIGTTRFHSIDPVHRHLEIGFTWIGIPWQRTLVNTEAKYLMLSHAFESMGYIRVEFRADSENEQSRRALVRIGACEEGILRHYRISTHRGIRNVTVYSIIGDEWPKVRADFEAKLAKRPDQAQEPTTVALPLR